MQIHNPTHPGQVILHDCIEPLGLTLTQTAKDLGIARSSLYMLINGDAAITSDIAVRLARVFGSNPEQWLRLQLQYDLWRSRRKLKAWKPAHTYASGAI